MSPKQLRFIDEYMKDRNGTQAAIRAGYSPKSAKVTASRMLTNANVKAEIAKRVGEYSQRAGLEIVGLLEQTKRIAFADIRHLFDDSGKLLHPAQWPKGIAAAVADFDVAEACGRNADGKPTPIVSTKRIRMADKLRALHMLLDFLREGEQVERSPKIPTSNIDVKPSQRRVRRLFEANGSALAFVITPKALPMPKVERDYSLDRVGDQWEARVPAIAGSRTRPAATPCLGDCSMYRVRACAIAASRP